MFGGGGLGYPPGSGSGDVAPASGGLSMFVVGASIESRAHPQWDYLVGNYQRVGGVVTVGFAAIGDDQYFLPGHAIRCGNPNHPEVEGRFEVISCTVVAGVSTQITYADPRSDIAAGSLAQGGTIHDLQAFTVASGWQPHLNMGVGGRVDIQTVATGGTNIVDEWGDERINQVAALGKFDMGLIGCGILGNGVKGFGAGPVEVYEATKALAKRLKQKIKPRIIFVESMPLCRDVGPTDPTFTAAERLNRMLWTKLQSELPYVRMVTGGETMVQNYGAYNANPSTDVANGWPEANSLTSDGVHAAYGWSRVRGFTLADSIMPYVARFTGPDMGMLASSRLVNTATDPEGGKNPNLSLGYWGNVAATQATLTGTGIGGVGPAGSSLLFVNGRGTSTAGGALATNPTGGTDWIVQITGNGSTFGYTLRITSAPTWLLNSLNDATVQGKQIDWYQPITLQFNENKLIYVAIELWVTKDGVTSRLAAPQTNAGKNGMIDLVRAMDGGYSGLMRAPRFKVPTGTYTMAEFRVTVREINGSVASGITTVRLGGNQRFEVVS